MKKVNNNYLIFSIIAILIIAISIILINLIPNNVEKISKPASTNSKNTVAGNNITFTILEEKYENGSITGIIRNNSNTNIRYVSVRTSYYDKNKNKLGESGDSITNLGPEQTWKFSIFTGYYDKQMTYDKLKINYNL